MDGATMLVALVATVALTVIAYQLWVANTPIRAQRKEADSTKEAEMDSLVASQIHHLSGQMVQVTLKYEAMMLDDSVGANPLNGDLRGILADADDDWIALETDRKGIVKLIRISQIKQLTGIQR